MSTLTIFATGGKNAKLSIIILIILLIMCYEIIMNNENLQNLIHVKFIATKTAYIICPPKKFVALRYFT